MKNNPVYDLGKSKRMLWYMFIFGAIVVNVNHFLNPYHLLRILVVTIISIVFTVTFFAYLLITKYQSSFNITHGFTVGVCLGIAVTILIYHLMTIDAALFFLIFLAPFINVAIFYPTLNKNKSRLYTYIIYYLWAATCATLVIITIISLFFGSVIGLTLARVGIISRPWSEIISMILIGIPVFWYIEKKMLQEMQSKFCLKMNEIGIAGTGGIFGIAVALIYHYFYFIHNDLSFSITEFDKDLIFIFTICTGFVVGFLMVYITIKEYAEENRLTKDTTEEVI